jgi:hypothetical protein
MAIPADILNRTILNKPILKGAILPTSIKEVVIPKTNVKTTPKFGTFDWYQYNKTASAGTMSIPPVAVATYHLLSELGANLTAEDGTLITIEY